MKAIKTLVLVYIGKKEKTPTKKTVVIRRFHGIIRSLNFRSDLPRLFSMFGNLHLIRQ